MKFSFQRGALIKLTRSPSVRAAGTYFTSTLINSAVPFLMLPIMTRLMEPSDYGRASMFQSIAYITTTTSGFALRAPLLRFFSINGAIPRKDYLASCIALTAICSLVTLLLIVAAHSEITSLTDLPLAWIVLGAISGIATSFSQIYLTALQADNRAISFAAFQVVTTLLNFAVSILFMLTFAAGWRGRSMGVLLSCVLGGLFGIAVFMWNRDIGIVRKDYLKEAAGLGGASMPHAFANALINYSDRFFMGGAYSMALVGVYSVSSRMSLAFFFLGNALNMALSPWAYRQLQALKTAEDFRRLTRVALGLVMVITVAAVLFYLTMIVVVDTMIPQKYAGSLLFLPWLIGAAYFNTIYFIFVQPIFFYKKARILSMSGLFILASGLAMIFLFSRLLGPMGVAMGMFGSRVILFVVATFFGIRLVHEALASSAADQRVPDAAQSKN